MGFIIRNLANIVTLGNLFLGFAAIIQVFKGDLIAASLLVFIAAFLDFFDGIIARALNITTDFGKMLDSFADMISFGLAPAFILHLMFLKTHHPAINSLFFTDISSLSLFPFIFTAAAAIRLGRFNIQKEKNTFYGLATPAAALFVAALAFIIEYDLYLIGLESLYLSGLILNIWLLMLITIVLSYLMILKYPFYKLNFNTSSLRSSAPSWFFILIFVILFVFFFFLAIPLIIIVYVLFSLIIKDLNNKKC
jgi:CDP-diacylglycerol---serine O-phosphatidyltransferase